MKTTCGIYLLNKDNELLITHPTNFGQDGCWSIPKGQPEESEMNLLAALRELREETSINLFYKGCKLQLPLSIYKSKAKILVSYLFKSDKLDKDTSIKCESYLYWKEKRIPENDDYAWIDINDSKLDTLLHEAQVENLKIIREWVNKK